MTPIERAAREGAEIRARWSALPEIGPIEDLPRLPLTDEQRASLDVLADAMIDAMLKEGGE